MVEEKKRKRWGCSTIVGVLFIGVVGANLVRKPNAHSPQRQPVATPAAEPNPSFSAGMQIRRAERAVRNSLRDPDSARFSGSVALERRGMHITCGYVNSRNGFGGYSGNAMWLVVDEIGAAVINSPRQEQEFAKLWNKCCAKI